MYCFVCSLNIGMNDFSQYTVNVKMLAIVLTCFIIDYLTVSACHRSCKSTCWEEGPKGCDECKEGWVQSEEEGCTGMATSNSAVGQITCAMINTSTGVKCLILWEFWIYYFSQRILEMIFVESIVNIRYECLFSAPEPTTRCQLYVIIFSHFRLQLWIQWTEFNETWQEARSQCPLQRVCFWGRSVKTRWLPWPPIGWKHFRLLLWNHQIQFNDTWQKARSQCPLLKRFSKINTWFVSFHFPMQTKKVYFNP